jgi:hypothetical protein
MLKQLPALRDLGVTSVEEYQLPAVIDERQGSPNWSFYERDASALGRLGLGYAVYNWVHVQPPWVTSGPEWSPYVCLEHHKAGDFPSLWAPTTRGLYRWYFNALKARMGPRVKGLYLTCPGDYGEAGYPAGMTDWLLTPKHTHRGFWCDDRFAHEDFRARMLGKYGSLGALNRAWGRSYQAPSEIAYPAPWGGQAQPSPVSGPALPNPNRRWWLDFVAWYHDSVGRFVAWQAGVAREFFPQAEVQIKLGYADERLEYGQDNSELPLLCARLGITCRSTHGDLPWFNYKRIATPCRFYGARYLTEPPGDVSPEQTIRRLFKDASCGPVAYFEYPQNLLAARPALSRYFRFLQPEQPILRTAIFFPTTDHRLQKDQTLPPRVLRLADGLRDLADFEVIDEPLIRRGALARYSVLAMPDGRVVEAETLRRIRVWIARGGRLVAHTDPVETVEGDRAPWAAITKVAQEPGHRVDLQPASGIDLRGFLAAISRALYRPSAGAGRVAAGFPCIDDAADGVLTTLFPTRLLFHNTKEEAQEVPISLSRAALRAVGAKVTGPGTLSLRLRLPANSLAMVDLATGRAVFGWSPQGEPYFSETDGLSLVQRARLVLDPHRQTLWAMAWISLAALCSLALLQSATGRDDARSERATERRWPSERFLPRLLLLALAVRLVWAISIPYDHAPDEKDHFKEVRVMHDYHRLPLFGKHGDTYVYVNPGTGSLRFPYTTFPTAGYLFSALMMFLLPTTMVPGYLAARMGSVLAGVALVWVTARLAEELFPEDRFLRVAPPLLVAFVPQAVFISAYVNADSFSVFSLGAGMLALVVAVRRGWPARETALAGAAMGLVALSKLNYWALMPVALMVLALRLRGTPRFVLGRLGLLFGVALMVSGWWFAHNILTYGDWNGAAATQAAIREFPGIRTATPGTERGLTPLTIAADRYWWELTFHSLWGRFGYMGSRMPSLAYMAIEMVLALGALGIALEASRLSRGGKREVHCTDPAVAGLYLLLIPLAIALSLAFSLRFDYQPQGRYLFSALLPFYFVALIGFRALMKRWFTERALLGFLTLGLCWLQVLGYLAARAG